MQKPAVASSAGFCFLIAHSLSAERCPNKRGLSSLPCAPAHRNLRAGVAGRNRPAKVGGGRREAAGAREEHNSSLISEALDPFLQNLDSGRSPKRMGD
jgi:hypothetical protein